MKKLTLILLFILLFTGCKSEQDVIEDTIKSHVIFVLYMVEDGEVKHRYVLRNDSNYKLETHEPMHLKMFNDLNQNKLMKGFIYLDPIRGNNSYKFIYDDKVEIDGKEINLNEIIKHRTIRST